MDCDYVVIGSGFGRSVSNLRLADKGEESDPYFNGMGPLQGGCAECAGCMVGCRENAKKYA